MRIPNLANLHYGPPSASEDPNKVFRTFFDGTTPQVANGVGYEKQALLSFSFALAAIITAIITTSAACYLGGLSVLPILFALPAIWCGRTAIKNISGNPKKGYYLGKSGFIIGILCLVICGLDFVASGVCFAI